MNKQDVLKKIEPVFRKVMEESTREFTEKLTSADVKLWDSMKNIELLLTLEKVFDTRFDADEVFGLPDIGALAELIVRKTG